MINEIFRTRLSYTRINALPMVKFCIATKHTLIWMKPKLYNIQNVPSYQALFSTNKLKWPPTKNKIVRKISQKVRVCCKTNIASGKIFTSLKLKVPSVSFTSNITLAFKYPIYKGRVFQRQTMEITLSDKQMLKLNFNTNLCTDLVS